MSTVLSARTKKYFWINWIITCSMGIFGAEAIGSLIPSIYVLATIGFVFSLALDLLARRLNWIESPHDAGSLGRKYPNYPLVLAAICIVVSYLLIANGSPTEPQDFVWAYLGGMIASLAITEFIVWNKLRKIGFVQ